MVGQKKKRSFIQQAKKFGRLGQRGRGTNIAQDQYDYLVRVLERWKDPFEEEEERAIFVANVFSQMEGDERNLAGNQLASRVIEMLILHANATTVHQFAQALAQDLRVVCMDQFASHVVEKLLILTSFKETEETHKQDMLVWTRKVCRFLANNLDEFCTNVYGSHLLRTCIQCITGSRLKTKDTSKQTVGYESMTTYQLKDDPDLVECLDILQTKILNLETSLLQEELASTVVQTFLKSCPPEKDRLKPVLKHLLETCYLDTPDHADCPALVRLLESVIEAAANFPKLFDKIHTKIFQGKLESLSTHDQGNFVVQRYLDFLPTSELLTTAWTEMSPNLEEILKTGHSGVVLALTKAAVRLKGEQAAILEQLGKALHCDDSLSQIAVCSYKMMVAERVEEEDLPVHLHGSLILQQLLNFNKPIQVVRSLLGVPNVQLRKLFSDPRGSHVLQVFVNSTTVGEKSRESMVKTLSGEYVSLACSKHGSIALEALWKTCSMKTKQTIVEELAKGESILRSHQFGKFVHQNCAVSVWKHQRDEWLKVINKSQKDRDLFKNILGTEGSKKRKQENSTAEEEKKKIKTEEVKAEVKEVVPEIKTEESDQQQPDVKEKKKKKKKAKSYLDDL